MLLMNLYQKAPKRFRSWRTVHTARPSSAKLKGVLVCALGSAAGFAAWNLPIKCDAPPLAVTPIPLSTKPAIVKLIKDDVPRGSKNLNLAIFLWRHIKGNWFLMGSIVGLAVATAVVNLQLPVILGKLTGAIQHLLAAKASTGVLELYLLARPAAQLASLYLVQGLLTFGTISLAAVLGERLASSLRRDLFKSLLNQDMWFFDTRMQGEIIARLVDDVNEFKHSFKLMSTQGVKACIQILGSAAQLLQISTPLALRMAMAAPAIYLLLSAYGSFLRRASRDAKNAEALCVNQITESLSNLRTVRSYVAEDRELAAYDAALTRAGAAQNRLGFHIGLFQGLTNVSVGGVVLSILYYGGRLVGNGDLSAGSLMAFLVTTQAAQRAFTTLGSLLGTFSRATDSLMRVRELAVERTPVIKRDEGLVPFKFHGAIEFSKVSFSYPSRPNYPVLTDLDLVLQPGQVTALCAQSGTGKTTIGQLIERFYDPTGGAILVDGLPLTHLSPKFVRENIGYIDQNPTLFATTIFENIKYGKPDASDEEVVEAARRSNVLEFANQLPDGLNTVVGERGVQMSGGMKQRIVIARAILKNPAFLILDEATSSLDAHSEALVQQSLQELMKNRTVLVIAHRLGTIRNADTIIVLGKRDKSLGAQVLESGTHSQLLKKRGYYYKFYELQDGIQL